MFKSLNFSTLALLFLFDTKSLVVFVCGNGVTSKELSTRPGHGAVKQGQEELGHDEDMSAIEI